HLKTTGCDTNAGDSNFTQNVCLADGSQFKYGIFDESCTDNICDTLTIDTNGKKGPNTAGKDRFTINLTPNGLKALGESDTCSTGLDCGAYILAHHKLFDGETIPVGCVDSNCTKCVASTHKMIDGTCTEKTDKEKATYAVLSACEGADTCTLTNLETPITLININGIWTTPTMASSEYGGVDTDSVISAHPSMDVCRVNGVNGYYIYSTEGYCYGNSYFDGAKKYCEEQGLTLPTLAQLETLYPSCSTTALGCGNFWVWSSEEKENSNGRQVYGVSFFNGERLIGTKDFNDDAKALCVSN
ncbi:hypothetical protein IJ732_02065, partial [bacterium]|nr:hypothetical protein [bacterium]